MTMCIICNCGVEAGDRFLVAFALAQVHMRRATEAMLVARDAANAPHARERYDRTHKAMVRLMREWNRLEEMRENDAHGVSNAEPQPTRCGGTEA